jgi:beta-glucosidase
MESNLYWTTIAAQVKAGKVPRSVVDEAVRRVLRVKFAMGLFEHPYADLSQASKVTLTPENMALAKQVAEESFVLLKNDGVLPLKPNANVAVIGPLADDAANMLGSWSAKADPQSVVTLWKALEDRSSGHATYAKGTDILGKSDAGFDEAVNAARQADVVVMALGEDGPVMTGEASSRTELGLPGNQQQLLEAVAAAGKPVVLLVFSGRPLVLDWAAEHVAAVMAVWHPGVQAGPALLDTLYGAYNPSGRLTVSFPRAVGQEPLYYNHLSTGRPLGDVDDSHLPTNGDEKYHSRYIDRPASALYPFGFGLSYTKFSYTPPTLSAKTFNSADLNAGRATVKVSADVRNDGAVAGDEVVQLYINQRGTSVALPVRELKGFQRVSLKPGESKHVEFTLSREELSFWNIDMKDVVEPAQVKVWVAGSSAAGTPAEFTIQ